MSNSLRPHGLNNLWNSPVQNTGVGSLSFLQGIFPTQRSNLGLLHCRQILCQLSHKGNPRILEWIRYPFSSGSSQPRNRTWVFCIAGRFFSNWGIREAPNSNMPFTKKIFFKFYLLPYYNSWLPVAQLVKNLPSMLETYVHSLGWEDPLEKGKATHSIILAWKIPWTVQYMGSQRVRHNWATFTFTYYNSKYNVPHINKTRDSKWSNAFFVTLLFCTGMQPINNVGIVSGELW